MSKCKNIKYYKNYVSINIKNIFKQINVAYFNFEVILG